MAKRGALTKYLVGSPVMNTDSNAEKLKQVLVKFIKDNYSGGFTVPNIQRFLMGLYFQNREFDTFNKTSLLEAIADTDNELVNEVRFIKTIRYFQDMEGVRSDIATNSVIAMREYCKLLRHYKANNGSIFNRDEFRQLAFTITGWMPKRAKEIIWEDYFESITPDEIFAKK